MKRPLLSAPDLVILAYQAIVAGLIVATWSRHDRPAAYLSLNVALMATTVALAALERSRPGKWTTFLHAWWPVVAVPLSFKEVAWVAPGVQPFSDYSWDYKLQELDERLFGDTRGFFRSIASAPVADILSIGYWSYFPLSLILGAALYRPPDLRRFREAVTVLLLGWFISYLGYYAIPAIGPHQVVDGARAPELNGVLWAGFLHKLLLAMEGRIPDAFPSGHALIAMIVLALSWRMHRRVFWWLLPFASGLILATMYLRYHYVVDVAVSALLLPLCLVFGRWIHRRREPPVAESWPVANEEGANMKKSVVSALIVVLAAGAVLAARARQEGIPQAPKPQKEHEWLQNFVGTWDFHAKFTMAPGAPPMEPKGVQLDRMTAGGLWLIIDAMEDKKEAPFHGHGMVGYDTEKKKFIGVWVDNHGTKFEMSEGTADMAANSLKMESEVTGMDGKPMKLKQASTIKDKDHKSLGFFSALPDGKEVKVGEIEYTRKK